MIPNCYILLSFGISYFMPKYEFKELLKFDFKVSKYQRLYLNLWPYLEYNISRLLERIIQIIIF